MAVEARVAVPHPDLWGPGCGGLELRSVVDRPGFEPGTSRVQAERSSRLSYRPAPLLPPLECGGLKCCLALGFGVECFLGVGLATA